MADESPGRPSKALETALRRLLRPLVRLLLARQITFPYMSDLLKTMYVSVAESDFAVSGKRQTDSRIHLLTGVHRKDVRRIRGQSGEPDPPPKTVSLGGQIVATWTGAPAYLDENDKPIPLPRLKTDGTTPSFDQLVESISRQDVRSRAALDELIRLGVVRLDEKDVVHLCMDAFVPERGFEEKAYYFGQNLRDHIASGAHNLMGEAPPFIDRSVYYKGLSGKSVEQLAAMSKTLGMEALQQVNRKALELREADRKNGGGASRINFGVFFYSDQQQSRPEEETTDA